MPYAGHKRQSVIRARQAAPLEKVEQQQIVQLARVLGAHVVELGTRRPAKCERCGTAAYSGTQQTPGKADLEIWFVITAARRLKMLVHGGITRELLLWETKRKVGGRIATEQQEYADMATAAGIAHGFGDFDAFIAWCVRAGYARADQFPHYRTKGLD